MKHLTLKLALAAILCGGLSMTAQAQVPCEDGMFAPAVYERWPHADDACLEIVTRDDGKKYARFEAEVVSQSPSGTYVRYTLKDGTKTPSRKVNPPRGFQARIAGQNIDIPDLNPRQQLNVFLPERTFPEPEPVAAAEPPPAPEPEPEPEPVMPTTAGNLGWLAIIGGMFLLLGGMLRFARQQS